MSALAFLVPVPSRCLHPNPEPRKKPFEVGDRVAWTQDKEKGRVVAISKHSLSVEWDESQYAVYCLTSGAIERIVVIHEGDEDKPGDWLS